MEMALHDHKRPICAALRKQLPLRPVYFAPCCFCPVNCLVCELLMYYRGHAKAIMPCFGMI